MLETLATMLDEYVPDYLVERVEMMLYSRIVNGWYTRPGLAQGAALRFEGRIHRPVCRGYGHARGCRWPVDRAELTGNRRMQMLSSR
jgi:hypothetical protein